MFLNTIYKKKYMVVILNDDHFVEGILGGIGAFFAVAIKEIVPNINPLILATIGFMSIWYIRKIGMNLYKEHKKINEIKSSNIELNINPLLLALAILMTLLYIVKPKNIIKHLDTRGTYIWLITMILLGLRVFF